MVECYRGVRVERCGVVEWSRGGEMWTKQWCRGGEMRSGTVV